MSIDYAERSRKAEATSNEALELLPTSPFSSAYLRNPASRLTPASYQFRTRHCSGAFTIFHSQLVEFTGYAVLTDRVGYFPSGELIHAPLTRNFNKNDFREFVLQFKDMRKRARRVDKAVRPNLLNATIRESNGLARRTRQCITDEGISTILSDAQVNRPARIQCFAGDKALTVDFLSSRHLVTRGVAVRACPCGCSVLSFTGETHDCPWKKDEDIPTEILQRFASELKKDLARPVSIQAGVQVNGIIFVL